MQKLEVGQLWLTCILLQKGCFEPASRAVSSGLGSLKPVKQRTAYIDNGIAGLQP